MRLRDTYLMRDFATTDKLCELTKFVRVILTTLRAPEIRVILVTTLTKYSHKTLSQNTLTKYYKILPHLCAQHRGISPYNPLLTRGSERGREGREGRGGRDEHTCGSKGHGRAPSWACEGFAPDGTSPGAFWERPGEG